MVIEHELYLQLLAQAHAVATYLDDRDLTGPCDGDLLKLSAEHVAALAGYVGADALDVAEALRHGLLVKRRQPQRYALFDSPGRLISGRFIALRRCDV